MKLQSLFEKISRYPVSVEFEQEIKLPDGEVDYRVIVVGGTVEMEQDPYNTGDSPNSAEFHETSAVVKDTKEKLNVTQFIKSLTAKQYDQLTDLALQSIE